MREEHWKGRNRKTKLRFQENVTNAGWSIIPAQLEIKTIEEPTLLEGFKMPHRKCYRHTLRYSILLLERYRFWRPLRPSKVLSESLVMLLLLRSTSTRILSLEKAASWTSWIWQFLKGRENRSNVININITYANKIPSNMFIVPIFNKP